MKKKRLLAGVLSVALLAGLLPTAFVAAAAQEPVTTVLACSDFQAKSGHEESKEIVREILDAMEEDGITSADGFICAGDYDYQEDTTAASTKAAMNELKEAVKDVVDQNMVLVQGNHDQPVAEFVSGDNDPASGEYGVFTINEDDYMWFNDNEIVIKETAENLRVYLNKKIESGYNKPIFVVSHLPLHYNMRTKKDGDGMHANYLFNILNAAAQKGLNLIFLYGHNHSNGWDDYLGGATVYLEKGDSILIAQNSRTDFKEETLHFTYMNPLAAGHGIDVKEFEVYGVAGTPCDTCEEKMVVRKIEGT